MVGNAGQWWGMCDRRNELRTQMNEIVKIFIYPRRWQCNLVSAAVKFVNTRANNNNQQHNTALCTCAHLHLRALAFAVTCAKKRNQRCPYICPTSTSTSTSPATFPLCSPLMSVENIPDSPPLPSHPQLCFPLLFLLSSPLLHSTTRTIHTTDRRLPRQPYS